MAEFHKTEDELSKLSPEEKAVIDLSWATKNMILAHNLRHPRGTKTVDKKFNVAARRVLKMLTGKTYSDDEIENLIWK